MRGTGILSVGGVPVYGFVAQVDGGVRFRVASREWEGLEVVAGQVVGVRVPGQAERALLVASVTELDGHTWVYFVRPVRAAC